jgi:LysM repeat protein
VVRSGETLKRIADKYRTSIAEILVYNPVKKKKIKKGEVLVVPVTQKVFEKFSKQNG